MGKKAPRAPAAPDPYQSAEAQAQFNRLNQFLPGGGSVLYGRYGSDQNFVPDYNHSAVQVTENPFQQQSRNLAESLSLQLANILGGNVNLPSTRSGIDYSGIARLPSINDFSNDAKQVEDATYNRVVNLLRPQFNRRRDQYSQQLSNQGIPLGAEAYQKEFDNLDRTENEALTSAAQDAVSAGRAEQQRLFANALTSRQSQINDQLQSAGLNNSARSSMLQELASLLGGQNFAPASYSYGVNSPGVDVIGAVNGNYLGQLNAYNSGIGQQRGYLQSVLGLGLGRGLSGLF